MGAWDVGRVATELESITWLPYPALRKSIQSLGGYELEQVWKVGYHTMRTLVGCRNPIEWPTVRMWQGYETALATYLANVLVEMERRLFEPQGEWGYFAAIVVDGPRVQSKRVFIDPDFAKLTTRSLRDQGYLPKWVGWRPLHESHRLALQTGDLTLVSWPWERGNISAQVRTGVLSQR